MNIKNARYMNIKNTLVDVEIEHPEFGWIPYTFNSAEEDESADAEIREYLSKLEPAEIASYFVDEGIQLQNEQSAFRAERDLLLAEADIEINKLVDAGLATTVYSEYRAALRDSTLVWVLPTKP